MSSFDNNLVLVFGVSGAGKTAICLDYCERRASAVYVSASSILKNHTGQTTEQLRLSKANDIRQNQLLLSETIKKMRRSKFSTTFVVDAHAVIDNGKQLVPVPIQVIESLAPTGLVLLEPSADLVIRQREASDRYRPVKTLAEIGEELYAERHTVESYSAALDIPLIVLHSPNTILLAEAVEEIAQTVPDNR